MNIGKRLQELREAKGWSTNYLATQSGLSQSFVRSVELGEKGISVENLELLCATLGIPIKAFFDLPGQEQTVSISLQLHAQVDRLTPKQKETLSLFLEQIL